MPRRHYISQLRRTSFHDTRPGESQCRIAAVAQPLAGPMSAARPTARCRAARARARPRWWPRCAAAAARTRCCGSARTPCPTNATASPPTASCRWLVALPETEAQVAAVLRACHAPERAGGGARRRHRACRGGALPHALGVTLSLAKFNRILQVDPRRAHRHRAVRRAQPGHQRGRGAATACTTRPTRAARSPAPSAATWPRTPAACTA